MWVHIFWGWSTRCCCCALYCLCILIVWLIWVVLKAWSWVPYWWNAWASTQCFSVLELRVPCPNRPDICPVPNACELRAVRPGRTREWSCYQHHNWGCNAKGLWVFFFYLAHLWHERDIQSFRCVMLMSRSITGTSLLPMRVPSCSCRSEKYNCTMNPSLVPHNKTEAPHHLRSCANQLAPAN